MPYQIDIQDLLYAHHPGESGIQLGAPELNARGDLGSQLLHVHIGLVPAVGGDHAAIGFSRGMMIEKISSRADGHYQPIDLQKGCGPRRIRRVERCMDLLAGYMDLLSISMSLVALVLGAAIGWLIARSRFRTTIAELNTKLILERRVNKQLSEAAQIDAMRSLMQAPSLTTPSDDLLREPTALSG